VLLFFPVPSAPTSVYPSIHPAFHPNIYLKSLLLYTQTHH
jgi:hypothetical protein